MLEAQSEALRMERLGVLKEHLKTIPKDVPVHLEMTSMVDPTFLKYILENVSDIFSDACFSCYFIFFNMLQAEFVTTKTCYKPCICLVNTILPYCIPVLFLFTF